MASRLTGQHGGSKQVIPWVTVVENHGAKGEVPMLYFTLPDGVGWDTWIGAIDHYTQRDTETDTHKYTRRHIEKHVLFGMNQRGSFLSPLFLFSTGITDLSNNIGHNKEDEVKKEELSRAGFKRGDMANVM